MGTDEEGKAIRVDPCHPWLRKSSTFSKDPAGAAAWYEYEDETPARQRENGP
jgi:hypothetical protein